MRPARTGMRLMPWTYSTLEPNQVVAWAGPRRLSGQNVSRASFGPFLEPLVSEEAPPLTRNGGAPVTRAASVGALSREVGSPPLGARRASRALGDSREAWSRIEGAPVVAMAAVPATEPAILFLAKAGS